jgi:hypothetical protein
MRFFKTLLCLALILTISSCAIKYDIVTDTESNINFKKYKTYAIIHDDHGFELGANFINKQRIDSAIESEIVAIGYEHSEKPDLQISWFIKVDTKLEQGIYNTYYSKWRSPRAIEVYEYQEGSLVIDIVESETGKVVWHGKVSGNITEEVPNVEEKIKQVVKEIFSSYKKDSGIKKINTYAIK